MIEDVLHRMTAPCSKRLNEENGQLASHLQEVNRIIGPLNLTMSIYSLRPLHLHH
jgi:hypothetical protein